MEIGQSGVLNLQNGMSGGADHAVVQGKTQAVLIGEMGVYDFGTRGVRLTEAGEKSLGVGRYVIPLAHGKQTVGLQEGKSAHPLPRRPEAPEAP